MITYSKCIQINENIPINMKTLIKILFCGYFKVSDKLFRPNFTLYYGRSLKSGPKFEILNCDISGTAEPVFKK